MPRKHEVEVFTFDELSPEVQKKVIDRNRDVNVDDAWYDYVEAEWINKLEEEGFGNAKIAFSGFGSQGDGASFTSDEVDLLKLIDPKHYPKLFAYLSSEDGAGCLVGTVRRTEPHYVHESSTSFEIEFHCSDAPDDLDDEVRKLRSEIDADMVKTGRQIYRDLEEEYEHLTSDEEVADFMMSNAIEFHRDGTPFKP